VPSTIRCVVVLIAEALMGPEGIVVADGATLRIFGQLGSSRYVLGRLEESRNMHSETSDPDSHEREREEANERYERERKEANERYERQRIADHEASEQRLKKRRKARAERRKRESELND
jgi:hypothetical protein